MLNKSNSFCNNSDNRKIVIGILVGTIKGKSSN